MKITKLSLAAIIAIGSITCANAQSLENAIKNVEVSGTVVYRYNDYEENNSAQKDDSYTANNYKAAINVSSKVNDDIKFNSRFIAGNQDNAGENVYSTQSESDENFDVFLSEVNFAYSGIENTMITIGKQGITTPFTLSRDSLGNEATGTGVVATTHMGDLVSLTGGYFNQTNLDTGDLLSSVVSGSNDFYYVNGVLAFSGITLDATYADSQDQFDAYSIGVATNIDLGAVSLNPYARYSELNEDVSDIENTLWKVGMGAQAGIFGAYIAYGETGEDGGNVAIDVSSDAGMDDHWRVTLTGINDASALYASVNAQVTEKLNLAVKYSEIDAGTASNDIDQNELYAQAAYKMSKNLSTYVRLGQLEKDGYYTDGSDLDSIIGRAHIQYSF